MAAEGHLVFPNSQAATKAIQEMCKGSSKGRITILGACVLLGRIAIGDWLTALITIGILIVLFRWKVSNLLLVE